MKKKTTKNRVSPLYPQSINITITEVQKHRRLLNYIIRLWRRNMKELDFPPEVNMILRFVPQLCFVPCFLLAYSCCRVGELKQIKIQSIIKNKDFCIRSSKSKHIRTIPALVNFSPEVRLSLDPKTMTCVVSYDHLKNAIRQAKKRGNISPVDNILDLTHIFRHLTATHMHRKGIELNVISEKLGHLNQDTTLQYIH